MDSAHFYHNLEVMDNFTDIADLTLYKPAPESWFMVITDVVSSTKAIEEGRYKDVNTVGALAIMALANIQQGIDFPFVFGGDGITALLPPYMLTKACDVLADVRSKSLSVFRLSLRVGIIPIQDLHAQGYEISVAKLRLSDSTYQTMLTGSGLDAAETFIKTHGRAERYLLAEDHKSSIRADYKGFSCKWQDIPSARGEVVSIIVKPLEHSLKANHTLLVEVLQTLQSICGSESEYRPLSVSTLHASTNAADARQEVQALQTKQSSLISNIKLWGTWLRNFAIAAIAKVSSVIQGYIVANVAANTDFRKFDGTLKMVISCTPEQRQRLNDYFAALHSSRRIAYGMHVAPKALMTCCVHTTGAGIHFIDGANGGYAIAAKHLKEQLRTMKTNSLR